MKRAISFVMKTTLRYRVFNLRYQGPYLWSKLSRVDINSRNIRQRDLAGVLEDNCEN